MKIEEEKNKKGKRKRKQIIQIELMLFLDSLVSGTWARLVPCSVQLYIGVKTSLTVQKALALSSLNAQLSGLPLLVDFCSGEGWVKKQQFDFSPLLYSLALFW